MFVEGIVFVGKLNMELDVLVNCGSYRENQETQSKTRITYRNLSYLSESENSLEASFQVHRAPFFKL